jgi:hypothetical protein
VHAGRGPDLVADAVTLALADAFTQPDRHPDARVDRPTAAAEQHAEAEANFEPHPGPDSDRSALELDDRRLVAALLLAA